MRIQCEVEMIFVVVCVNQHVVGAPLLVPITATMVDFSVLSNREKPFRELLACSRLSACNHTTKN